MIGIIDLKHHSPINKDCSASLQLLGQTLKNLKGTTINTPVFIAQLSLES